MGRLLWDSYSAHKHCEGRAQCFSAKYGGKGKAHLTTCHEIPEGK